MSDNLEADFTVQRNNLNAEFDVASNDLVAELVVQYTPNKTSQLINDSGFVTQSDITSAVSDEATLREAADDHLQSQIDQWNGAFEGYRNAADQDIIDNAIRADIEHEADVRNANDIVLQRNIDEKQDIITDLNTIRAGASAGATAVQPSELNNYVPTTRTVNGKALSANITLTATDVGALGSSTVHNDLSGRSSSGAHPISAITDLQTTLNGKQATLTTAQLAAVNSGVTAVDVEKISTNTSNITTISSKIPSAATSSNQLADKAFVNSSINAVAAYYITSDAQGDAFATKAALDAGPWYFNGDSRTPTTNDYALVEEDETHSNATTRYTYTGSQWAYQYTLNTTPFSQAQLDALNSGIDANLVSGYSAHVADTDIHVTTAEKTTWDGKQDAISDLNDIRSGAQAGATAVQPADLATVATTGAYSDLSGTPTIPTVNDATLTIQKNGTTVQTFTANASTNATANITVPTDTSDLTNGAGFITGISSSDVTTALGYTPYDSSNPSGYTSNVGTVTSVNNVSPVNGNVSLTIPTVNNPTITITQCGVTKGSFTLNQASGDTIALDAGGAGGGNDLFDFKWADHELDDQSWTRADNFSWQDGTVYSDAYDHLSDDYDSVATSTDLVIDVSGATYTLTRDDTSDQTINNVTYYAWTDGSSLLLYTTDDPPTTSSSLYTITDPTDPIIPYRCTILSVPNEKISNTETIGSYTITYYLASDGHKIILPDMETTALNIYSESGIAWYYVLDTTNTRFKLPRTKYGFVGYRDVLGKYVAPELPNITGDNGNYRIISSNTSTDPTGTGNGAFKYTSVGSSKVGGSGTNYYSVSFEIDASDSDSTYKNGGKVQQAATQMYLYFYVGEFSQSATEQTAGLNASLFNGKADVDLGNISSAGQNVVKGIFDTKIVLVNSLPATPDNDVWYAIPE